MQQEEQQEEQREGRQELWFADTTTAILAKEALREIVFRQAGRLTIFPTPGKWWLDCACQNAI